MNAENLILFLIIIGVMSLFIWLLSLVTSAVKKAFSGLGFSKVGEEVSSAIGGTIFLGGCALAGNAFRHDGPLAGFIQETA